VLGLDVLLVSKALYLNLWYPAKVCILEFLPLHLMLLQRRLGLLCIINQGIPLSSRKMFTLCMLYDIFLILLIPYDINQDKPIYSWIKQVSGGCESWVLSGYAFQDEVWRRRFSWKKVHNSFPFLVLIWRSCCCCSFWFLWVLIVRFTGTIVGTGDISSQWSESKWRSLKVKNMFGFIDGNVWHIHCLVLILV